MTITEYVTKIPWDTEVFKLDASEIHLVSEQVMKQICNKEGHYTVKVDPLASKEILHKYGFYYCDTLIEPYCNKDCFHFFKHDSVSISKCSSFDGFAGMIQGAFVYDRFHRDFNIDRDLADLRYKCWLRNLFDKGNVFSLMINQRSVGFFAYSENRIVLHAISEKFRKKGLAKYLWSIACHELFSKGYQELVSSISISNMPILNLYSSLGFKFRNPKDVYHKYIKGTDC